MSHADGLKSLSPSPHRVAARTIKRWVDEKPWLLALASLVVGLFVCLVSVGALGGYALEHPAHNTLWTDRLEIMGTIVAVATVAASVLSLAISRAVETGEPGGAVCRLAARAGPRVGPVEDAVLSA